ncbi:MAG: Hsp20/alpha crystallin family protein [Polyangiaceae bacterium]|nr:Hsp20/alpha crystallin family protein [Polyangiaceae bacterium]
MGLVRWDPFRELDELSERLNTVFRRSPLVRAGGTQRDMMMPEWQPAVDIVESNNEFQIKVELPEVKKEDVKVTLHQGQLRIEGERKLEKEEKDKKYHRVERFYGQFVRTFMVPDNVDEARLSADFKDGLLNIHLPKTEKHVPKPVDVKIL